MLNFKENNLINFVGTIMLFIILCSGFFLNFGINLMYLSLIIYFVFNFRVFKNADKINVFEKLLYAFFIYLNLNALFKYFFYDYYNINLLIKCLLYNKILVLYLVLKQIIFHINLDKLKKVLLIINFLVIFLIFDLLFQSYFSKDIFGFEMSSYGRLTGPYGDEFVPGFLIFSLGSISYFLFIFSDTIYKKTLLFYFLYVIFFTTILLTGERIVFFGSLMFLVLIFIFVFNSKKKIFVSNVLLLGLIFCVLIFNDTLNLKYKIFLEQINLTDKQPININLNQEPAKTKQDQILSHAKSDKQKIPNIYLNIFKSGIQTWKKNPVWGAGFGSFRLVCIKNTNIEKSLRCNSHPHNIYLEILSETGFVGFLMFACLILSMMITIFRFLVNEIIIKKKFDIFYLILLLSFSVSLVNIWPIRSTGRLFSNFYGTIFWINLFFSFLFYYKVRNRDHFSN